MYIYIFNPVFKWLGFGLNLVLLGVSFFYAFLNFVETKRYLKAYRHEIWIILFIISFLFLRIQTATTQEGYDEVFRVVDMLLSQLLIPMFIVRFVLIKCKEAGFYNIMITVGVVAALITLVCALSPAVNMFVRGLQTDREFSGMSTTSQMELGYRCFGLATNLTSAYGYMMGVFGSLCLVQMKSRWHYFLFVILFLFAAAVNARTGMMAIFVTLFLLAFNSAYSLSIKQMLLIFVFIAAVFFGYNSLKVYLPSTYDFISSFVDFISDSNNYEGSYYDRNLHFPKTSDGIIWGEGINIYGTNSIYSSDIGFVRNVYLGGFFFIGLLLIHQFVLYKKMIRRSGDFIFIIGLAISVLIFHYKGLVLYTSSAISRFVMLYYFVLVYNELHKKSKILLYK